ncbi:3-dehydroquinate dehydratase [Paenibacillus oenotherae]|uniref:3-dehydroquinate dehydratase n=1 Tax=Paenibacillus oenotherae TaxID=1435645 RepID=A0ABS7DAI2_9BACL|nr:type II 3-dehydroquinate dehydratase [Paenibacillus oenotherae]MBW7476502.1 3-dehydroquinate dehydratase [Paenibacillus oenotherae]
MRVLLINGPNMNFLGIREPEIYGSRTLEEVERDLTAWSSRNGIELECFQSNSEGDIVGKIHKGYGTTDGLVINPASLSQSYPIREAIVACGMRAVEIHMSNIYSREDWHSVSVLSPVVIGMITGFGEYGYRLAIQALACK